MSASIETKNKGKDYDDNTNEVEDSRKEYVNLLQIPQEIIFPLELSIHLKERLQTALEEIFRLKKLLFNQDYEITCLHLKAEKSKSDKYFETKESKLKMANPQMATKVVELSKKIRDMTAEQESMKTRMRQLMSENDQLRDNLETRKSQTTNSNRTCANNNDFNDSSSERTFTSACKTDEELMSTAQQLANTTAKMMDYRRQSQQLRIELRTALKALSQEVGEGTTPQTVLNTVTGSSATTSSSTWRGRQQQILALQQKMSELNLKLQQQQQQIQHHQQQQQQQQQQQPPQQVHSTTMSPSSCSFSVSHMGGGESCHPDSQSVSELDSCSELPASEMYATNDKSNCSTINSSFSTILPITAAQRRLQGLHQQERNKHEQLEKTQQQLEATKKELKASLMSMKGYKARVQTLEDQVRSCRSQIEVLEGKCGGKQMEVQEGMNENKRLNQELEIFKDRMKTLRDTASAELMEGHQALVKERGQCGKLQKLIDNYEEKLSGLNVEMRDLQISLIAYQSSPADELEARKRLQYLELQFEEMKEGMRASESECRRLLSLMEESVSRVEEERGNHCGTQRHLLKSFAVIDHAEKCISLCLDAGHIHDKQILETIEDLRSMKRELKTGDLYHLDPVNLTDVRKLKSRVSLLNKEIGVLQSHLKQSAMERKKDLQQFGSMVERTRHEFFTALTNSVRVKQLEKPRAKPTSTTTTSTAAAAAAAVGVGVGAVPTSTTTTATATTTFNPSKHQHACESNS